MKTIHPLYIAFIWHMHQPYYKRFDTGEHVMPWVRLHGTKDYLDMPLLVEETRGMKATFNLVPSLLEQVDEFARGEAVEKTLELSQRNAADLIFEEKRFLITRFFASNHDRMILPHPRYEELYVSRGWARTEEEMNRAVQYFSIEDLRDLQVWFNLSWIDPLFREKDEFLRGLVAKGRDFTEEEKQRVLETCLKLLREIMPAYKRLQEQGAIEVSVSPYYHPILPLLYDTNFARRCLPNHPLPKIRFHHPEDANHQIQSACEFYTKRLGIPPKGMWPSEGAVCPELIPLFSKAGLHWIATDEEICALSLGPGLFNRDSSGELSPSEADLLYQPYIARFHNAEMVLLFRDHFLSDLIGFQYAGWNPEEAAQDLVKRLKKIHTDLKEAKSPRIVTIILDGENCWEFYENDGLPFLRALYHMIVNEPELEPITPSGFLESHKVEKKLPHLYTGSWINHNFSIWIGHEEDRLSWELLAQTHDDVSSQMSDPQKNLSAGDRERIKTILAVAEGSDWNWWYGDDHSSGMDDQFDALYRNHLSQAYQSAGLETPSRLHLPIRTRPAIEKVQEPQGFIKPVLDGRNTSYFEWLSAGSYETSSGSMHRSHHSILRFYYGFDLETLYLRIDPNPDFLSSSNPVPVTFILAIYEPAPWRIRIKMDPQSGRGLTAQCYRETETRAWSYAFSLETVAYDRILEMAIPFHQIGLEPNMVLHFQIIIQSQDHEIERCPATAPVLLTVPTSDYEKSLWLV